MPIKSQMNNFDDLQDIVISNDEESCTLPVHVAPNSSNSKIGAIDTWRKSLKVSLVSEPTSGKANSELQGLFSKLFDLSPGSVVIVSGLKSRRKTIRMKIARGSLISGLISEIDSEK